MDASNPKLAKEDIKYYSTLKHPETKFTWKPMFYTTVLSSNTMLFSSGELTSSATCTSICNLIQSGSSCVIMYYARNASRCMIYGKWKGQTSEYLWLTDGCTLRNNSFWQFPPKWQIYISNKFYKNVITLYTHCTQYCSSIYINVYKISIKNVRVLTHG